MGWNGEILVKMGSFSLEGRCRETRLLPWAAEVIIHHLQLLIKGKTSWIKHEAGSGVRKHFPSPSTAFKSFQNHPDSNQPFSFLWSLQIWKECKKYHWVEPAATESLGCTCCIIRVVLHGTYNALMLLHTQSRSISAMSLCGRPDKRALCRLHPKATRAAGDSAAALQKWGNCLLWGRPDAGHGAASAL